MSFLFLGFLALILLALLVLVFEIVMFIDVLQNKKLSSNDRWLWVIGMLLFHPFVAIVYYFMTRSSKLD
jgi:hypothetical protein